MYGVAFAAIVEVPAHPVLDQQRILADVRSTLNPTAADTLRSKQVPVEGRGSHIRIRYRSQTPVPLTFAPRHAQFADGYDPVDLLFAILPASNAGDALLPLVASPGWRRGREDAVITFYGLDKVSPFIVDIAMEEHATFLHRVIAYASHLLRPEPFAITSVHFLRGYKVAGFALPLLFIDAFVLLVVLLRFWRRWSWDRAVIMSLLVIVAVYTARFSVDHVGATIHDLREWRSHHTYRDAGELYNVADAVKQEAQVSTQMSITVCTDIPSLHDTPLKYLLHPIPVSKMEEGWRTATHALLFADWTQADGAISCHGQSRFGDVLTIFPDGSAFVRFLHPLT